MQASGGIEVPAYAEVARLDLFDLRKRFGMAMDPGCLFSVRIPPRVIQHADPEAADAAPVRFGLELGTQLFHITVCPRIVAMPFCDQGPGESLFRLLLSLVCRSGKRAIFVHPFALPGTGRQRDALIQVARPFHHRPNRPADIENHAPVSAHTAIKRFEPVPELACRRRGVLLLEPVEIDLEPSVRVQRSCARRRGAP